MDVVADGGVEVVVWIFHGVLVMPSPARCTFVNVVVALVVCSMCGVVGCVFVVRVVVCVVVC